MADFEREETSVSLVAVTAAVGAVVLLLVLLCGLGRKNTEEEKKDDEEEENGKSNGAVKEKNKPSGLKKQKSQDKKKDGKHTFTHPWLASTLKGHTLPVLSFDISPNGKYLAACAEDRSILLWSAKDFSKKDNKSIRANVELDHATRIKFSPDNRAFILSLYRENTVRVMRIGKKSDNTPGNFETLIDFPKGHTSEILNIGIASSGKFIMTCSKDTIIKVWDLKGEELAKIDTHQVNNSYAAVSPCGRFVASCGFTSDVKVWEVCFEKGGGFKEVTRAFELKGHSAGVYYFSFNSDSTRMASVSKDGTWKTWDTNIEYQKGQDPYLLKTGKYNHTGFTRIALSPDARTVALSSGSNLYIYNALTAHLKQTIEDVHSLPISGILFDSRSHYLLTTGDKHIQAFHNVVGLEATVEDLKEKKIASTNQAQREWFQQQIDDAQSSLQSIKDAEA